MWAFMRNSPGPSMKKIGNLEISAACMSLAPTRTGPELPDSSHFVAHFGACHAAPAHANLSHASGAIG